MTARQSVSVFLFLGAFLSACSGGTTGGEDEVCGNGTVGTGEVCDGTQLDGETCSSRGFSSGTLACASNCKSFDTSGCQSAAVCGNGSANAGEQCDGSDLGGVTCDGLGYTGGTLSCSSTCRFVTTSCVGGSCGNGYIDGVESCDGTNLDGENCTTLGLGFVGGSLSCTAGCAFDTSACTNAGLCGNGSVDTGEDCDGTNLGGDTCLTLGYTGGTLACAGNCQHNTNNCTVPANCGNAAIDVPEQCDGANLNSQTCVTQGFASGTLACTGACLYDTGACVAAATCGNGAINGTEDCDGTNLGGETCTTIPGGFVGGTLACSGTCTFNTSSCIAAPVCGNATIEAGEDCEGTNLGGLTCLTLGYTGGTLTCTAGCVFNESACTVPVDCGNGSIETASGETCDGTNLGGETCESLGFGSGVLACTGACLFDVSACVAIDLCGNDIINGSEQCDGTILGGWTCEDLGFSGGVLSCDGTCQFDTSSCEPAADCGDGTVDLGEDCDTSNLDGATCVSLGFASGTLTCTSGCLFNTGACVPAADCGNGTVNLGEDCDGSDLNDQTCVSQGFASGTLVCTAGCQFNTAACVPVNNCGNGSINAGELCDGSNMNGQTCASVLGAGATGTLACNGTCTAFITTGCSVPLCGNGTINGGEQCDGANLNSQTCVTQGFSSGTLTCTAACQFNTSACVSAAECGNSFIDFGEMCDGTHLGPNTCASIGYTAGSLTCSPSCTVVTTACTGGGVWTCNAAWNGTGDGCDCGCGALDPDCANGNLASCQYLDCDFGTPAIEGQNWLCIEGTRLGCEDCISELDCAGAGTVCLNFGGDNPSFCSVRCESVSCGAGYTCVDVGGAGNGPEACVPTAGDICAECTPTSCPTTECGDSVVNGVEECDGSDLDGQTCTSLGFTSGTLTCSASCSFNTAGCTGGGTGLLCQDCTLDSDCAGVGTQCVGFTAGNEFCATDCAATGTCPPGYSCYTLGAAELCAPTDGDICASCTPTGCPTDCGNAAVDAGEQCDGTNLDGETCSSLGFTGGTLACSAACAFNTAGCTGGATCTPANTIACGQARTGNTTGAGATDLVSLYPCAPTWPEDGPEYAYTFTNDATAGSVTMTLTGLAADLDIFVLDSSGGVCNPGACVMADDDTATFSAAANATYYVVVDGYNGATSAYTLTASCP